MKPLPRFIHSLKAFTLTEIMITVTIMGIVGGGFLLFSNQALRSFTWLTATNVAHQSARVGIQNMLQDIHSSASPLLLVNVRGQAPAPQEGTFQGIVFQQRHAGPVQVNGDVIAGANTLSLGLGNAFVPEIGQNIILLGSTNLYRITNVGALNGQNRTVTIAPAIQANDTMAISGTAATNSPTEGGSEMITAYITQRAAYLVQPSETVEDSSELRYYPLVQRWTGSPANGHLQGRGGENTQDLFFFIPAGPNSNTNALNNPDTFSTMTRGLRTVDVDGTYMAPFSDPGDEDDTPNRTAVAAVQISLQDNNVTNLIAPDEQGRRTLNATTLFLNSNIPLRYIITNQQ